MVEYEYMLNELKKTLQEKGLKFTRQREIILSTLFNNRGHYSPEELQQIMQREHPDTKVGIATIYRTLSLLEKVGLVESISFGIEGKKYEIGYRRHHDHLVCSECGKIIEFYDETIEERQEEVAKKYNFLMKGHSMKIIGLCQECQTKEND